MTIRAAFRAATISAVALIGLAGCGSNPNDVSFDAITGDLTPHLLGLTERDVDADRNIAVMKNQNIRMMWGDLGRAFLWDRPSRLSPYDIISTSGQPSQ
jgi:hypothetical protein